MDPNLLKVLHLAGVIALFTSIGAIFAGGCEKCRKHASMLHGISLLLIVLVGFAILRKPPMDQHWWQVKFVIWLFLGAAPALAKREVLPRPVLMGICLLGGFVAAYLGVAKPF
jgi:hypothetical protein